MNYTYTYTAYTKIINDTEFFFVKKYVHFPEVKNAAPVLESYGMHIDFSKACRIAGIVDADLIQEIYKQINPAITYGQSTVSPLLSKSLRVELINNKTSLVSKITGIKRMLSSKMPHWRILSHS